MVKTLRSSINTGLRQSIFASATGLAAFNEAQLTFRYHMHGDNMGQFRFLWESGGTYTLLTDPILSGEQQPLTTSPWLLGSSGTILHNKDGETGNIVVVGRKLSAHKTDMAFCEISVTTQSGTITLNAMDADWKTATTTSASVSAAQTKATTEFLTDSGGSYVWRRDTGSTPSSGTGPDKHHDDTSTSEYIYFEGSTPANYSFATLRTASTITL